MISLRPASWRSPQARRKSCCRFCLFSVSPTRLAALGLLVMTLVVQLTVPDGWPLHVTGV
jgi:hypothetical protein